MNNNDKNLWAYYQINNVDVFSTTHDRHEKVYSEVERYVQPSSNVLEIGFGDGYLLNKLSRRYFCFGSDISENVIKNIKNRLGGVSFKVMSIDGVLPYNDNFFSGFIASEVLEHMADGELSVCVDEIYRVLKKGGYAFITFPAEENLRENECYCPECNNVFHRWGHKQSWSEARIRKVFSKFKIIKINDYFVRHEGAGFLENIIGYIFYLGRNFINKFNKLPNRSYLVVLKKI